jgi:hypothetical protein
MPKQDHKLIEAEVTNLVGKLRGTWPTSDLPCELYHYTDAKGLLGILRDKRFWATDINFLNDAMELRYASELINRVLDKKIDPNIDDAVKDLLTDSRLFLKLQPSTMNAYVVCFCENGNLLSQWRAYGASGSGYSLGVISDSLKGDEREGPGAPIFETRLRKVVYDKTIQEHLVTETIGRFCDLLHRIVEDVDQDGSRSTVNDFANYLTAELSEYLYCFKSSVFEEEQEWRIIHTATNYRAFDEDADALKFRASGANIIPYIELPFAAPTQPFVARGYPISSITFGPSLHPELTARSLYVLLDSTLGYGNGVRISSSDIPLRHAIS